METITYQEFMEAWQNRDESYQGQEQAENGFTCGHEPLNEHGRGWYPYEAYFVDKAGNYCRDIVELN